MMSRIALSSILACSVLAAATSTWASSAANVRIASIALNRSYGFGFVKFETAPGDKPACSNHYWDYTIPMTTPFDDKLYATLLAAFEAGNAVSVLGAGACTEFAEIESIASVQLVP